MTDPRATDPLTPPEWSDNVWTTLEAWPGFSEAIERGRAQLAAGQSVEFEPHHHGRYMLFAALVGVVIGLLLSQVLAAPRAAAVIPAGTIASDATTRGVEDPESDRRQLGAPRPPSTPAERVGTRQNLLASAAAPHSSPTVRVPASPSGTLTGIASWYRNGSGLYAAAGPSLRTGRWRGRSVEVCAGRCVVVRLTDWCACPHRLIDLSADAFARLTPLSRGLVRVTISTALSLPETDR